MKNSVAINNHAHPKPLKSPFFSIVMLSLNFTGRLSDVYVLNALSCTGVPDNVAGKPGCNQSCCRFCSFPHIFYAFCLQVSKGSGWLILQHFFLHILIHLIFLLHLVRPQFTSVTSLDTLTTLHCFILMLLLRVGVCSRCHRIEWTHKPRRDSIPGGMFSLTREPLEKLIRPVPCSVSAKSNRIILETEKNMDLIFICSLGKKENVFYSGKW